MIIQRKNALERKLERAKKHKTLMARQTEKFRLLALEADQQQKQQEGEALQAEQQEEQPQEQQGEATPVKENAAAAEMWYLSSWRKQTHSLSFSLFLGPVSKSNKCRNAVTNLQFE